MPALSCCLFCWTTSNNVPAEDLLFSESDDILARFRFNFDLVWLWNQCVESLMMILDWKIRWPFRFEVCRAQPKPRIAHLVALPPSLLAMPTVHSATRIHPNVDYFRSNILHCFSFISFIKLVYNFNETATI